MVIGGPTWAKDGSNNSGREYWKKLENFDDEEGSMRWKPLKSPYFSTNLPAESSLKMIKQSNQCAAAQTNLWPEDAFLKILMEGLERSSRRGWKGRFTLAQQEPNLAHWNLLSLLLKNVLR